MEKYINKGHMFFTLNWDIIKSEKIIKAFFIYCVITFSEENMSWKVFEECFDKDEHWNSTRCCLWLNFISHLWGAHQGTAFRYEFSFKMFIVLLCIFLSVDSLLAINVSHKCLNQKNQWTSPIFVFIINIFATNQMNGKHMSGCQNSPSFLLTWRRLKEIKSCTILAEKMESIPIVPVCNKRLPDKYFLTFPNFKMKIFTH